MAGKLVALLDRLAPRDLYDVASFLNQQPSHDPEMLRRLFIGLSGTLPRALTAYGLDHLEKFSRRDVEIGLAPFLRTEERPELGALKSQVGLFLGKLLDLSVEENAYAERIQWGDFMPEKLAGQDADVLNRLRTHPALLWKVENARRRRS